MIALKFFDDIPHALGYITDELPATLKDDADARRHDEDESEDVAELDNKIEDIEALEPLIMSLPSLLDFAETAALGNTEYDDLQIMAAAILKNIKP